MPLIPLPLNAITQMTFVGSLFEQRIINTFHLQFQGTPSPSVDYRDYYDALLDTVSEPLGMKAKFLAITPTNYTLLSIRLQTIWPTRQRYVERGINEPGGDAPGLALSANSAYSIRRVSDVIGPRGVGRIQIPIGATWMDEGNVAAAAAAPIAAFTPYMETSLFTVGPDAEYLPVLFGVSGGTAHTSEVIEAQQEYTIRVMRRRTLHVGE